MLINQSQNCNDFWVIKINILKRSLKMAIEKYLCNIVFVLYSEYLKNKKC